jgi:hypothetical protein
MADQYTPEEIQAIFEEYNNATKGGSQATAELTARFKDAQTGIKNYTAQLNASMQKLGTSVLGVAKAMKDGEQGASVYNDSINSAADAIDSFASKFGFLGKIIGTLITAGARYAVEVNKQSDALFDSYKKLSQSGLADAGGMTAIFDNMQKFGYGINELGTMTELLKANSKELAAFGGTAASGTKAFADAAGQIQRSEVGKSLQMLGKTPDDINKGTAMFVKQQQQSGLANSAITKDLSQQSAAYIKNLDMLSKLTGESAEGLQAKLDDAMAEDAFNQTLYELKKKAAAGDAEAGRLATEYENAARQLTGESLKEFQKGVGGDISAMSKTMMVSSEAVSEIGKKSFTAAGYLDKMKTGADRFREGMGGAYKLNALGDVAFSAKELSQIQSRYADETAQQQQDRAKAEQDLQQKGLDPATKAQVEMRIEQMKTRDEFQSLINKGINPVTKGMAKLAGGIESVTDKIPGSGTSTGTQMGGGKTGSNWWDPSTWGQGAAAQTQAQQQAPATTAPAAPPQTSVPGKADPTKPSDDIIAGMSKSVESTRSETSVPATAAPTTAAPAKPAGPQGTGPTVDKSKEIAGGAGGAGGLFKGKSLDGINSGLKDALTQAVMAYGKPVTVTSALRSFEDQQRLYNDYISGKSPYPAAKPGQSKHGAGNAVDLDSKDANALAAGGFLAKFGLGRPVKGDPVHIQQISAADGAILSGPAGGYQPNLTMHGTEAIVPLNKSTSGPTDKYDSKMADVNPNKTLPPKEVQTASQSTDPTKASEDIIAAMAEHMENQTRALRDVADNTKKSAQYAAT